MKITILILPLMISYTVILLTTGWVNKIKPGITTYGEPQPANFKMLNYLHAISILMMILPVLTTASAPFFLLSFPDKINLGQTIAFLACFGIIGFFPWKKMYQGDQKTDNTILPLPSIFLYGSLRLLFLISYEWFFRALLLVNLSSWLDIRYGIIANVLLYALIHIHKSKKEIIACLPFGLLVCVFTVWWQSVWPAIIFHLQIAIVNEWPPFQKIISPQKQAAL
jgi:membrane protease YdiL (CAAX protease family)